MSDRDEDAEYWQMLQDFRGGKPARNAPEEQQPPQGRRAAGPRRRREAPAEDDFGGYPGPRPGAPVGPGGYSEPGAGAQQQQNYGRRVDRNREQPSPGGQDWAEERQTWGGGGRTGEQTYGRRSGQFPVPKQPPPSTPPQGWSPDPQPPPPPPAAQPRKERGRSGRRRPERGEQGGEQQRPGWGQPPPDAAPPPWGSGPIEQPRERRAPGWPEAPQPGQPSGPPSGPQPGPQSGAQAMPPHGPQAGPQSGPPSGAQAIPGSAGPRSGELRQPDNRRRRGDQPADTPQDWSPPPAFASAESPHPGGAGLAEPPAIDPHEDAATQETRRGRRALGEDEDESKPRGIMGLLKLSAIDREVLGIWLLTRVSLWMISITAPWLFAGDGGVTGWLARWRQWDVLHFDRIATQGYFGHQEPEEAFFPGLPLLMRLFHTIGMPTTFTGLLVSFVAGGIAAVALGRLADREWGEGAGRRATMAWMLAPPAVFLAAPYTESLFLGFAIPAWLAARKSNWRLAGLLAAGACTVRVSGLFLMVALAVEFLTSRKRRGTAFNWLQGAWLAVPAVPLLAYMSYLWVNTGDPLRWYHAQSQGWYREFTMPWDSLIRTWQAATGQIKYTNATAAIQANFDWMFRAELVAMVIGIVITVVLCLLARWGEATWIGLQVVAFSTSAWFFSVPRATLLWFPLWIFFGALALRHRLVWWGYLAISAPLFGVWAAAFFTGRWSG